MPLHEIDLWKIRVKLELVDGWFYGGLVEQLVQLVGREVGDAYVSDFAGIEELLHGEPSLHK